MTGVVQHEYFKFQVQKQVEAEVHAYVSARARTIGVLLTAAATMLGAFGWTQYLTFTSVVDEVHKKSAALDTEIQRTRDLANDATNGLSTAKTLLEAAKENVTHSREVTASASDAAQQTRELARSVLDQARLTQADVLNKSSEFQKNVEGAAEKITLLNNAQDKALAVTASLAGIPIAASEARQRFEAIQKTAERVEQTQRTLDQNLNLERQLMVAKTFEIVLLRDRRSVDITLPDVRDPKAKPYVFTIEATRIKNDVDFRITVNGRRPVLAFDRFVAGQRAVIAEDVPFEVRVDSIYHAKLAYDFVLLRIKPTEGPSTQTSPALASTRAEGE